VTAPPVLWQPGPARVERSTLTQYERWLAAERGIELGSYEDLWRWSVEELDGFWLSLWDFFEIAADSRPERALGRRAMPGAEWFPGTRLSYAEHVFRGRDDSAVALQHASELRALEAWTWAELREHTARVATGLRRLGVREGDRVAAYLPNIPEALAALYACASIGAVWSSCSPDFGAGAAVDRFGQIEPKVLLAVDGYRYGGRDFDRRELVGSVRDALPSLEQVVSLPYLGCGPLAGALDWAELVAEQEPLHFARLPFEHPLWVLYTSGTTGQPKALVHSQGGILLEHVKHVRLHLDAQADDRIFWFTTTGWMMWNFLVGVLLTPASIVLYDGSPAAPDLGVLWDLAEHAGVTCFGTSAAYIAACM
jgi:acetoacetyl-CoA synthetase